MTERFDRTPEPDIPGDMVRELGIAPALSGTDPAAEALVDLAREETDEIVERVKAEQQSARDAARGGEGS